jgi:DNA invertase Pin-like site-specific DNA recombinase
MVEDPDPLNLAVAMPYPYSQRPMRITIMPTEVPVSKAAAPKYVAYLRVSTARQGASGLGLEAQRDTVRQFVASRGGKIIAPEFVEVESGKINARPELAKAINRCKATGATLCVAKLDRLSRNAAFLMTLRDSGVQFIACDLPEANTMTIGVMAVVAQHEREMISARTKAALGATKAHGTKLGGRREGSPDISTYAAAASSARTAKADERLAAKADDLRKLEGLSLNEMARRLNAMSIQAPRGGQWSAMTVSRALKRLAELKP